MTDKLHANSVRQILLENAINLISPSFVYILSQLSLDLKWAPVVGLGVGGALPCKTLKSKTLRLWESHLKGFKSASYLYFGKSYYCQCSL